MRSKTETAARRLVADIHRATDGQPMRWCGLSETSQRAKAAELAKSLGPY
jgi:hypothetical protein